MRLDPNRPSLGELSVNAHESAIQSGGAGVFFGPPGNDFPTVHRVGATPDPISNSEVKPHIGDGTAGFSRWESSATVGFLYRTSSILDGVLFYLGAAGLSSSAGRRAACR